MSGFDDLRARVQADIFAGLPAHFSGLSWSEGQLRGWQRDRLRALPATEVQVEAVCSLPRHPETGKLRRVVPA
jgi:hypothetical protein